ncbi:DNA polymerase epsilon catalytic subunit A-like protein [Tanacetum coccineum]
MPKIRINVPRVFYLNTKSSVSKGFPRRLVICEHLCYKFIKVTTDEDQNRTERRKLNAHLADPEVEISGLCWKTKDADKILQRVPLGNIEPDWLIHTTDLFFARALRDQKQIHYLAVNVLLKSRQINEMEGSSLFGLDETMSFSPAFRVLKQLI